jgi:hypothetical protein
LALAVGIAQAETTQFCLLLPQRVAVEAAQTQVPEMRMAHPVVQVAAVKVLV